MSDKHKTDINELRRIMEQELSSKRYLHTLGVSYTAACLAMAHGADMESAMTAGLLHDCAKPLKGEEQIALCEKYQLDISDVERLNPSALLHAKVGAYLAQSRYGVTVPDILNAIKYHTTGRPKMSKLEKILYIADYIEPGRKHVADLEQIRQVAYQDLDATMARILENTLAYLKPTDGQIAPMTEETYQYYKHS
mgnify:FL=1